LRKEMNKRYKLLMRARKTPKGSPQWRIYKVQCNRCTQMVRKTESDHWKDKFDTCQNSKSFWKTVAEFQGKKVTKKIGTLLDSDNKIIVEDSDKANLHTVSY